MVERMGESWLRSAFRASVPQPLRRSLWRYRLRREIRLAFNGRMPPVAVFSVQKTASTAVAEALRAIEGQAVFHFHYLDENYIRTIGAAMRWPEITQHGQKEAGLRA